jgi:hypothetical protein
MAKLQPQSATALLRLLVAELMLQYGTSVCAEGVLQRVIGSVEVFSIHQPSRPNLGFFLPCLFRRLRLKFSGSSIVLRSINPFYSLEVRCVLPEKLDLHPDFIASFCRALSSVSAVCISTGVLGSMISRFNWCSPCPPSYLSTLSRPPLNPLLSKRRPSICPRDNEMRIIIMII